VAPSTTGGAFGSNVYVFSPARSQASIQSTLDSIASQQVSNQFGAQRYAVFFEPGTYGSSTDPLIFQVGYYTTVAGLGLNPGDVVINGQINVYNSAYRNARQPHQLPVTEHRGPLPRSERGSGPRSCIYARPGSECTTTQIACTGSPVLFRYSCGVEESKAIESPGPSS
jgi:hypothetical protein